MTEFRFKVVNQLNFIDFLVYDVLNDSNKREGKPFAANLPLKNLFNKSDVSKLCIV
jgi:hypothetical protein